LPHQRLGRAGRPGTGDEYESTGGRRRVGDPEAASRPRRRWFSAAYKRRVLEETDQLQGPGEIGSYLRREGLYSSALCRWRAQRDRGLLDVLAPRRRGPKASSHSAERARIAELERESENLRARLRQAEQIIEV